MKVQIEEMAKDICHLNVSCDECTMLAKQMGQSKERYCKAMQYAKRAYEKGYRKQSEGEWKPSDVLPDDGDGHEWVRYTCSICGVFTDTYYHDVRDVHKFCPNCGANMKGADT